MIVGFSGVCCRDKIFEMTIDEIEDKDSYINVKIPDSVVPNTYL